MKYEFVLHEVAARFVAGCTKREQARLLDLFKEIAESHHEPGATYFRSLQGRELEMKEFGSWSIVYWVDAPVRRVMIVDCAKLR